MGKPSSTRLSRKSSDHSVHSNVSRKKLNTPMSTQKMEIAKKKNHKNINNKIKRLFNELRKSQSSCNSLINDSVILLDDSAVDVDTSTHGKRILASDTRKGNSKKIKCEDHCDGNLVVITDDNDHDTNNMPCSTNTPKKNLAPICCSTPLASHKNKSINEPNISSLSNGQNSSTTQINKTVIDLTKENNSNSFFTIDLTTATKSACNTVIDLDNTLDSQDCTFVTASDANLSMSMDSDVTVLSRSECERSKERQMRRFADGISKLDASEKGRLLELITQNIFSGCSVPKRLKKKLSNINRISTNQGTNTIENTYIKEVILGQCNSRNSIGSNIYNPEKDFKKDGLRMVVIDGSNVAMQHGKGKIFSVKGLRICIDYFIKRGHIVKAFVPQFRCKFGKSSEPRALDELERRGLVVYTPSREIQGRMVTSYDDRYIVQCAAEFDGVIVSCDNYRDLHKENPRWRFVIENRVLPFTWVNDMLMFPRDPLGRNGPTLEQFLRHPPERMK